MRDDERFRLGPREGERIWERHLVNSAALVSRIPPGVDVMDVGSGAGLPGIPVALARPDVHMTLVEPMERRCIFLREVVNELQIDARVRRVRAEQVSPGSADVVVARAVAPLTRLLPLLIPLVRRPGRVLALKGTSAAAELASAQQVLAQWPHARAAIATVGGATVTAHVVQVDVEAREVASR